MISGATAKNESQFSNLIQKLLEENPIISAVNLSSKDVAAITWCKKTETPYKIVDADFDENGNNAIYVQNALLIENSEAAIIIRKDESDKTKTDLLKKCVKQQLEIYRNV